MLEGNLLTCFLATLILLSTPKYLLPHVFTPVKTHYTDPNGVYTWSEWSACSANCGDTGTTYRTRQNLPKRPSNHTNIAQIQYKSCNNHIPCPQNCIEAPAAKIPTTQCPSICSRKTIREYQQKFTLQYPIQPISGGTICQKSTTDPQPCQPTTKYACRSIKVNDVFPIQFPKDYPSSYTPPNTSITLYSNCLTSVAQSAISLHCPSSRRLSILQSHLVRSPDCLAANNASNCIGDITRFAFLRCNYRESCTLSVDDLLDEVFTLDPFMPECILTTGVDDIQSFKLEILYKCMNDNNKVLADNNTFRIYWGVSLNKNVLVEIDTPNVTSIETCANACNQETECTFWEHGLVPTISQNDDSTGPFEMKTREAVSLFHSKCSLFNVKNNNKMSPGEGLKALNAWDNTQDLDYTGERRMRVRISGVRTSILSNETNTGRQDPRVRIGDMMAGRWEVMAAVEGRDMDGDGFEDRLLYIVVYGEDDGVAVEGEGMVYRYFYSSRLGGYVNSLDEELALVPFGGGETVRVGLADWEYCRGGGLYEDGVQLVGVVGRRVVCARGDDELSVALIERSREDEEFLIFLLNVEYPLFDLARDFIPGDTGHHMVHVVDETYARRILSGGFHFNGIYRHEKISENHVTPIFNTTATEFENCMLICKKHPACTNINYQPITKKCQIVQQNILNFTGTHTNTVSGLPVLYKNGTHCEFKQNIPKFAKVKNNNQNNRNNNLFCQHRGLSFAAAPDYFTQFNQTLSKNELLKEAASAENLPVKKLPTQTENECNSECQHDPACKAWTFFPEILLCILIPETVVSFRYMRYPVAVSAPKKCFNQFCTFSGVAITGGVLLDEFSMIAQDDAAIKTCLDECVSNSLCSAWQVHFYNFNNNKCSLYADTDTRSMAIGWVTAASNRDWDDGHGGTLMGGDLKEDVMMVRLMGNDDREKVRRTGGRLMILEDGILGARMARGVEVVDDVCILTDGMLGLFSGGGCYV